MTHCDKLGVRVAIVVGEACGTKEQGRTLLATGHDDTEVVHTKELLIRFGHGNLDAGQVFDSLVLSDRFAGDSRSLVGNDSVTVGGGNFKGTVGKIDVDIFPEMVLEVFLFFFGREAVEVARQSRQLQQMLCG